MINKLLAAVAASAALAAPAFAADQNVDLSTGEASFVGTSPLLAGGDDVISFTGLAAGTYEFVLTISAHNIQNMTATFNDMPVMFDYSGKASLGWLESSGNAPFTLLINGTALSRGKYSGELTTTPVPEPGTYALMLAGLAAMGFVAKRRGAQR